MALRMERISFALAGLLLITACSTDSSRMRGLPAGGAAGQSQVIAGVGGVGGQDFQNPAGTMAPPVQEMEPPVVQDPVSNEPVNIDACGADNAAGLSVEDVQKLLAGGGTAGSIRVLYPYAGTVFPRGMMAPLLMWDGAAAEADAVYVHLKNSLFEYRGCLTPTAPGQLQLPQDVWVAAGGQTLGARDPFTLELSAIQAGTVTGPVSQQLTIAQATIKGSIFYNSYSSALGMGGGMIGGGFPGAGGNGIVLRIPPGGTAEAFASMECNGCHSVSADGSRLISTAPGTGSKAFALTPGIAPNPPSTNAGPKGAFGALFPDGSLYLAMSTVTNVARVPLVADFTAPVDATLYRTDDGTVVANTGIPPGVLMPTFSPSGRTLAFNDYAINGPGGDGAHGIAVMDFDAATNTASNYRELFNDSEYRPGWPFTLPDDRAVVFTRTDGPDFSGDGAGLFPGTRGPFSDLYIGDIASGTVTVLAKAMGYDTPDSAGSNTTYLPFGADDLHGNYFPTVSPVAAGGYFWVFFDSLRGYGNLGVQRQLWGAAIDVLADGNYALDPSHPPFYLPGQEFGTGNHRAFAALDPCKQDGNTCTSGTDCCGGFCHVPEGPEEFEVELEGTCDSQVPECSNLNERCTTAGDCCPSEAGAQPLLCIAGFCAKPIDVQ